MVPATDFFMPCSVLRTLAFLIALILSVPVVAQQPASIDEAVNAAVAQASKSVVAIARVRRDEASPPWVEQRRFPSDDYPLGSGPVDPEFMPHEFGLGVVVDRGGLILTTLHVLGEINNSQYFVWAQRRVFQAQVVAADPWLDIAVLEIPTDDLSPIEFGSAREVRPGDNAVAIGNPFGIARDGEPEVSFGVVSQLACEAPAQSLPTMRNGLESLIPRRETLHHYGTLLRLETKLPLRESGGPLINLEGELIGLMTTYNAEPVEDVEAAFALPIDAGFIKSLETLKQGRLPEYGLLGLAPRPARLVDPTIKSGAAVEDVMPGTPAARVGLRVGDVITHVDDELVIDDRHLIRLVSALPAEAKITLQYIRDPRSRKTLSVSVALSKKYHESSREAFARQREPAWRGMRVDYATASPVFRELARHVDPEGCVAVIEVERDSPAWKAGLRSGTFVSHIGKRRVSTPQQFRDAAHEQVGEAALRVTMAGEGDPVRKVAAP